MRKILDKMFGNKKLSFFIPLLSAAVVYLLFVLFSSAEDKNHMMIATPIVTVIGFFGVFLIVFFQVKNTACPAWFLNSLELFVTVAFGIYAIAATVSFIMSGLQNFSVAICPGMVTYSAVSWAHNKRTD